MALTPKEVMPMVITRAEQIEHILILLFISVILTECSVSSLLPNFHALVAQKV